MLFDCKLFLVIYYVKFIHIEKCVINQKYIYNINKNKLKLLFIPFIGEMYAMVFLLLIYIYI